MAFMNNFGANSPGSHHAAQCCGSMLPQNISQMERWTSLGLGGALVLGGLTKINLRGIVLACMGGALVHRGITGHCYGYDLLGIDTAERHPATSVPAQQGIKLEQSITIQQPTEALFDFWRNFENLPRVMRHLESVKVLDDRRSHWVAGVAGKSVEWDAEIINERPNELIAWRSLPGGDVDTAGSIHFKRLANDAGTELILSMKYNPPGGKLVANLAELIGVGAIHKIAEDLQRFKELMEAKELSPAQSRRF